MSLDPELWQQLQDRLLKMGGTQVFDLNPALNELRKTEGYQQQTRHLLEHGVEFDGKANFLLGRITGGCHVHASGLYFFSNHRAAMWTGWALNDWEWTEHSWNVFEGEIYETNGNWTKYFGVAHPNPEPWATFELTKAGEFRDDPEEYKDLFSGDERSVGILAKLRTA